MQFKEQNVSGLNREYWFDDESYGNETIFTAQGNLPLDDVAAKIKEVEAAFGPPMDLGDRTWTYTVDKNVSDSSETIELGDDGTWHVAGGWEGTETIQFELVFRNKKDAALFKLGNDVI